MNRDSRRLKFVVASFLLLASVILVVLYRSQIRSDTLFGIRSSVPLLHYTFPGSAKPGSLHGHHPLPAEQDVMRNTISHLGYTSAGSAKPGSLHGHLSMPSPFKTVQDATDAVHQASFFHHSGQTQNKEWEACMQETSGRGPCPPWDTFGGPEHSHSRVVPARIVPTPRRPPQDSAQPLPVRKAAHPPVINGHFKMHAAECSEDTGSGCYTDEHGILRYCPSGSYCPRGSLKPVGCPANSVSPRGADNVTDCHALPGYFGPAGTAGTRCPEGFYCEAGAEEPVPCPNNTESSAGATKITDCVSLPGFRGEPGAAAIICSANTYCPPGQDQYSNCPQNTHSPPGSTTAAACQSVGGAYGKPGEPAEFCPPEHYCPPGTESPIRCPPNTNATLGSDRATDCQAIPGYYGPAGSEAVFCPADYFCPKRAENATACPANTTSPAGSIFSSDCKSKAGYYGTPGVAADLCPPGFFCPPGVDLYEKCPNNTLSVAGSSSLLDCLTLPGFYAAPGEAGMLCPEGFYCPAGSIRARPCPSNTESKAGSTFLRECTVRQGYFGLPGRDAEACPAGSYCPSRAVAASPCPNNTDSPAASFRLVDCRSLPGFYGEPGTAAKICPAGSFCPANENMYVSCPANTVSREGASVRKECEALAGFYGEPGTNGTECPEDRFCPAGAIHPAGCPPNTFSPPGSSAITDCKAQAGFEGPWGVQANACEPGFYCPTTAVEPTPCPSGTISPADAVRLRDCVPARGYFGTPGTSATLCLQAHYCPGATAQPVDCPANTNSLPGAGSSVECRARAGFYGDDGYPATLCSVGSYCPTKSTRPLACPENTQSPAGATQIGDCAAKPGFFGAAGTAAVPCPANQYCPGGGSVQNVCPAYTASPAQSSQVKDCSAIPGYFGLPGIDAKACPANSYCPGGGNGALPCPADSPISDPGGTSLAACRPSGWTMRIFKIPVGTTFTPSRPGELLGQSNLPQTIMMDNEASFRKWVPACPDDWFSWQFYGRIAITTAGAYTFAIESDDGSLLYLNLLPAPTMNAQSGAAAPLLATSTDVGGGKERAQVYSLIIDNDGLHGARKYTRTVSLQPGLYNAKVTGFEAAGNTVMRFTYSGPDTNGQFIPTPSVDSHVPSVDSAQSNGWTIQIFAVPQGTAESPTAFPATNLVGTNDNMPIVNLGSDNEVRGYVAATPKYYSWRIFGNLAITTGGLYSFCTESDDGSLFYLSGLSSADPSGYTLVVDNDGIHGTTRVCNDIKLASGVYGAKVTGFQWGGGLAMRLYYKGPDTGDQYWFVRSTGISRVIEEDPAKGSWLLRLYAVPIGIAATPRNFYARNAIGQSALVPRVAFDDLATFRRYVASTPDTNYAWLFLGKVLVNNAGDYTFCITSDDGSMLYMSGGVIGPSFVLQIANDGLHGANQKCKTITLGAGIYNAKVTGFQAGGGVMMRFTYSGPDTGGQFRFVRSFDTQTVDIAPSFKDPNSNLPAVFSQGLHARYTYNSWDPAKLVWNDISGNKRNGVGSGSGFSTGCDTDQNGAAGTVCSVRGTPSSAVNFGPGTVPATFTICSISRYNGRNTGRILAGDGNWLHGHWATNVGVAYYEGWKTGAATAISVQPTDWILLCGQNAPPGIFLANGVSVGNGAGGGNGNIAFGVNALGCCGRSEASDWAIAEISVWNRALSADELETVLTYYG